MVKKWLSVALLAILGVVLIWPHLPGHDARAIRKTWNQLIALCETDGPQNLLTSATRATEVLACFATGSVVEVGAPYPMILQRNELPALLQRAWSHASRIELNSRGEDITLDQPRKEATMETTMEVAMTIEGRRETGLDTYSVRWKKVKRDWRITRVERLQTIRLPAPTPGDQ